MKTTFSTSELPHLWAHRKIDGGKSPSALSVRGPTIFSYSTAIAEHVTNKNGAAIFYNGSGYSITTSKHQSKIRQAIPSGVLVIDVFGVPRGTSRLMDLPAKGIVQTLMDHAARALASAEKAKRFKQSHESRAASYLTNAKAAAKFLGVRVKIDETVLARLKASHQREHALEAKRRKAAEKAREADDAKKLASWLAGEPDVCPSSHWAVRLRRVGDTMETSRGARVPMVDAERAFRFACKVRATGWRKNGETHKVGHYELDAVNNDGVVAGCHRVSWAEIERFSLAVGWSS